MCTPIRTRPPTAGSTRRGRCARSGARSQDPVCSSMSMSRSARCAAGSATSSPRPTRRPGRGVAGGSLGVRSSLESEAAGSGRPQSRRQVDAALALLAAADFPTVNLDLIYGLPGQTVQTWLYSVRQALAFAPDEIYLYPLYVRPLTGLGRARQGRDDIRLACYRA